ncbi:MAG: site-2 protease family protein [Opitutaceae bacterium]
MDFLNWLVPLAVIFPLIYLLRVWLVMKAILGLRFGPARVTSLPFESISAHMREAVAGFEPELSALGFEPTSGWHVVPHTGEAWAGESISFHHSTDPIGISFGANPRADSSGRLFANVVTLLASGTELHTTNFRNENILPAPRFMQEETMEGAEIGALVARHRERVATANAAGDANVVPTEEMRATRLQARLEGMWDSLRNSGFTVAEPDGRLVFKFGAAWNTARRIMREEAARARAAKKKSQRGAQPPVLLTPASQAEFDHACYRHLVALQAGRLAWIPKTVLMLVSLATFALALGWKLSVASAFVLLAVLIFHEAGHLLGMRWFGHRDTQLLFLPFFGGAAVALDHRVLKPWQHLVILFLGPLPGIFIGFALLAWAPQGNHWVQEFTWMLLALNIFNLLPILPLDGGQIMDNAFITRFPKLRLVFLALSGLGMIGVAVFAQGGTILWVLGGFMLFRLPIELKTARLIKSLRRELPPEGASEEGTVRRVLTCLRQQDWAKVAPAQRLHLARSFYRTLQQPLPGWGTVAFAAAGYLSPLWVPLLALLPLYGVGVWRLQKAEEHARAEGLIVERPMSAVRVDDAAKDNFSTANKLLAAQMDARVAFYRSLKDLATTSGGDRAEAGAMEEAAMVAAIREGCAAWRSEAQSAAGSESALMMAHTLSNEVRRLARAGDARGAAEVIDDQISLVKYARTVRGTAAGMVHLQVVDEVLNSIENFTTRVPQPDGLKRWNAVLDETNLRQELSAAYRALATDLVEPEMGRADHNEGLMMVFTWLGRWPAHRAEALEKVSESRVAANKGDFSAPAFLLSDGAGWSSITFNLGTMRLSSLRAQALRLVCRQRLARAAMALRDSGLVPADVGEISPELARAWDAHPVSRVAIVLARDERGAVLRFGPRRVSKKMTEAMSAVGDFPGAADTAALAETAAMTAAELQWEMNDVEWRLTPVQEVPGAEI